MDKNINQPSKFRKKPVEIEAVQLTFENQTEVKAWCNGQTWSRPPMRAVTGISIETLEGTMDAEYGDYIIKGVKGEFYPCKPDIFEMTYEPMTFREYPDDPTQEQLDQLARIAERPAEAPASSDEWEHRFIDGPDTSWHPGRLTNLDMSVRLVYEERPKAPASSGHTAHTPGPWRKAMPAYPKGDSIDGLWKCPIEHRPDDIMPAVAYGASKEEAEANAELIARAPMMEKEFEVARNRVVELLDEKIALSKELQAHKDAIEQHITVLQESSLELDRIEREGKQLRKELQEAREEIEALRRDDSLPMRTVISERDNARKELQEARAALEKIESLSKYKSDHDQILYDFKEIHEIATAVLSSPHDTQKL